MEIEEQSSKNTVNTASGSEQFDYYNIKEKFNEELSKCCSRKVSLVSPCWTEVVNFIIKAIVDGKAVKNEPGLDTFASRAMEIYDVINQDENQLLVLKNKNEEEENIVVIPNEDCFELLAKIHLENNHADQKEMLQIIRKKYSIREENICLFLDLCNICKPSRQMYQAKNKKAYKVFVMDLSNFRDEPYVYLLTLVEKFTGFFHLRPLVFKDASEVAIELYKIFADYGPPFELMTPNTELFLAVNSIISKMCPIFSYNVKLIAENEIQKYDELVKTELCEWIAMTGCANWATGCRMIQWKINNIETDGTTPYEAMFGVRPNDSLYMNPVWLRIGEVRDEKVARLLKMYKEEFVISPIERSHTSKSIVELNSNDSEVDASSSVVDVIDNVRKCVICLHPVYRLSFCNTCCKPVHDFCGTRFAGRNRTIYNLCMKCKNTKLST